MATYQKRLLSGVSSSAIPILITASISPGAPVIHTAVSGTADLDEIWIWAMNSASNAQKLTIQWNATAAPDGNIEQTIPPESGLVLVIPGLLMNNSGSVAAFSASPSVVTINGFVNRITA